MKALRSGAVDVCPEAVLYLREAVAAFYMDCLLSTCVLLGLAAEIEFLRLLHVAKNSQTYGNYFSRIGDGLHIRAKISRFQEAIKPILGLLPRAATEELENNLHIMQSLLASRKTIPGNRRAETAVARPGLCLSSTIYSFCRAADAVRQELNEPVATAACPRDLNGPSTAKKRRYAASFRAPAPNPEPPSACAGRR